MTMTELSQAAERARRKCPTYGDPYSGRVCARRRDGARADCRRCVNMHLMESLDLAA
jgi:hypothetical protein